MAQSSTERLKRRRTKLWIQNPHCIYCGVETILPEDVERGKPAPPHMATIDHKYSRFHSLRTTPNSPMEIRRVLCCNLCNNYKAQLEADKIPIEILRARSKQGYRDGIRQECPEIPPLKEFYGIPIFKISV